MAVRWATSFRYLKTQSTPRKPLFASSLRAGSTILVFLGLFLEEMWRPPIDLGQAPQPVTHPVIQHVISNAPAPVAARATGRVHAAFTADAQDVLQGKDDALRHGHHCQADQIPANIVPMAAQVDLRARPCCPVQAVPPAESGVVVVSAGVDHTVALVVVGQIGIVGIVCKGELQHLHARKAELIAQRLNAAVDEAEIFDDDRQPSEGPLGRAKEVCAGALHPAAFYGGLFAGGNGPVGLEPAEMIQTDDVDLLQGCPETLDPPDIAVARQYIPAVKWISPKLTGRAEVVRRNARHERRAAVFVKPEQLRV